MFPDLGGYLLILEKVLAVIGAVIYFIFALVIVKQVTMMAKSINDKFNGILITFSYLHLLGAGMLVVMALILL